MPYDRISDGRMGPARWWLERLVNVQVPWLTVYYFTYGLVLARCSVPSAVLTQK